MAQRSIHQLARGSLEASPNSRVDTAVDTSDNGRDEPQREPQGQPSHQSRETSGRASRPRWTSGEETKTRYGDKICKHWGLPDVDRFFDFEFPVGDERLKDVTNDDLRPTILSDKLLKLLWSIAEEYGRSSLDQARLDIAINAVENKSSQHGYRVRPMVLKRVLDKSRASKVRGSLLSNSSRSNMLLGFVFSVHDSLFNWRVFFFVYI